VRAYPDLRRHDIGLDALNEPAEDVVSFGGNRQAELA